MPMAKGGNSERAKVPTIKNQEEAKTQIKVVGCSPTGSSHNAGERMRIRGGGELLRRPRSTPGCSAN